MTATITATDLLGEDGQPCSGACQHALSDDSLCTCSTCGGARHGLVHQARHEATRQMVRDRHRRAGGVMAYIGAANDDFDPNQW